MRMFKGIILLAALLACTTVQAMAASPPEVPAMPADFQGIKVSQPDPAVPAELNQLLGEWQGVWIVRPRPGDLPTKVRKAKMIVYEVTPTKVKYLWGVGYNPLIQGQANWTKRESGFQERHGKNIFSHEGLYGYRTETRPAEFFLDNGVIQGNVGSASIEMKKVK